MAPVTERITATSPGQSTAGSTLSKTVAQSHVAGVVSSVTFTPDAGVTAHGTNYRTFRLLNKGAAGSGTTVVASFATDTVTTDDLTAFVEKSIDLSATPADLVVAAGDLLVWDETVAASGVASPTGRIEVEITRTA